MATLSDGQLGEALWSRSKQFVREGDFYNALLDLGAAYRLLRLANSTEAEKVRLDWESAFKAASEVKEAPPQPQAAKGEEKTLNDLLTKVQRRKESP